MCGICLDEFGGAIGQVALGKEGVEDPNVGCCHVFHSPCMHAQIVHKIRTIAMGNLFINVLFVGQSSLRMSMRNGQVKR